MEVQADQSEAACSDVSANRRAARGRDLKCRRGGKKSCGKVAVVFFFLGNGEKWEFLQLLNRPQ